MLPVKKIQFSNSTLCIQDENGFEVELDRDRGSRGFLYLYRDCSIGLGGTRLAAIIDLEDKGDVFLFERLEDENNDDPS